MDRPGPSASPSSVMATSTTNGHVDKGKQKANPEDQLDEEGQGRRKRRKKVAKACIFCKRSHMTCDDARPCHRCIKREIGHLCTDEIGPTSKPEPVNVLPPPSSHNGLPMGGIPMNALQPQAQSLLQQGEPSVNLGTSTLAMRNPQLRTGPSPFLNPSIPPASSSFLPAGSLSAYSFSTPSDPFGLELAGPSRDMTRASAPLVQQNGANDFSGLALGDFLKSLDDATFLNTDALLDGYSSQFPPAPERPLDPFLGSPPVGGGARPASPPRPPVSPALAPANPNLPVHEPAASRHVKEKEAGADVNGETDPTAPADKTERFLLTAADQKDGSRDERLARVIHAKFEAGLLKPYNYVAGYTRLMRWMESHMSASSRQRVLQTLSEFRPAFRAMASSLTDLDLVFIEEAFERLLLDYDRVFSTMGPPACLWRRTGEIYKGNKEFAELVGVPIEALRDGRLAVYELMSEESAVNFWARYSEIAFDKGQKAVLTSCVLRNQAVAEQALERVRRRKLQAGKAVAGSSSSGAGTGPGGAGGAATAKVKLTRDELDQVDRAASVTCTFSFTVRRDVVGVPTLIVGNFIALH